MTEAVTEAELDDLFDSATASIFRLETLPAYDVDEEADRIAQWRAGQPRPEQSVRTSEWLREIAASTLAGVRWERVRVVDDPLTEYQRYQLPALVEMQTAGCSVGVVERRAYTGTWHAPIVDFWLFDGGTDRAAAVEMVYTDSGRYVGARRADPGGIARDADLWRTMARPLNEYVAVRCAV